MRNFSSMGAFVGHLKRIRRTAARDLEMALADAGRLVQERAQESIGDYQSAAGPFAAWQPLAETTLAGFTNERGHHFPGKEELGFAPPDRPLERTEDLKHAIELSYNAIKAVVGVPDEQAGNGSLHSPFRNLGDVAVDLEFGTEKMPARSFLGRSLFVSAHEVTQIIGKAVANIVAGKRYEPHVRAHAHDVPF